MLIELDPFSQAFINFANTVCKMRSSLPVLEIGAACGVVACQVAKAQTSIVATERFPDQLNFPACALQAVLMCRVTHFLTGEEFEVGFKKIYEWLIPGGKFFMIASTPYSKNLTWFVETYEQRQKNGEWPGYIFGEKNVRRAFPSLADNLPSFLHVFTEASLRKALNETGFEIEKIEFVDYKETLPSLAYKGQEDIGVITAKPNLPLVKR